MGNVLVSLSVRNGILAILLSDDGSLMKEHVERINDADAVSNIYLGMIYGFNVALRITRQYIQDNKNSREVTFELSNSTFVKWIDNRYSRPEYQEQFMASLYVLQSLPIKYRFSYNQRPKAWYYAIKEKCKSAKLEGLLV